MRVVDCMPPRERDPDLVRVVEGVRGEVTMRMELIVRFDYGSIVPWVRSIDGDVACDRRAGCRVAVVAGAELRGEGPHDPGELHRSRGRAGPVPPDVASVARGRRTEPPDAERAVEHTCAWWEQWCGQCTYEGEWRDDVLRSLIVLKALTFAPTGGIVAAPTTSLPEQIGGVRNWDYRFCWLRDATFTLYSLLSCGFTSEARAWRAWLLRAVAGDPGGSADHVRPARRAAARPSWS